MNDLKPCPFCGEAPYCFGSDETQHVMVECTNPECFVCPSLLMPSTSIQEASDESNRRATVGQGMGKEAS